MSDIGHGHQSEISGKKPVRTRLEAERDRESENGGSTSPCWTITFKNQSHLKNKSKILFLSLINISY
ncbi:hypothetical protein TorRG33x02_283070 [Trema orientale]|uniref:Uncharacterized protein n=1 Tax=Trema orientale TaxID=63057 RepID=A0A2P5CIX3_TREOI|nr:hypothetical protein TorRG33x02_283070 [Trema orientale]